MKTRKDLCKCQEHGMKECLNTSEAKGELARPTPTPLESLISTSPNGKVTMPGIENYLHSPYVDKQFKDDLAAFIVRAVNSHEELVAILKSIYDDLKQGAIPNDLSFIDKVLSQAEGR